MIQKEYYETVKEDSERKMEENDDSLQTFNRMMIDMQRPFPSTKSKIQ